MPRPGRASSLLAVTAMSAGTSAMMDKERVRESMTCRRTALEVSAAAKYRSNSTVAAVTMHVAGTAKECPAPWSPFALAATSSTAADCGRHRARGRDPPTKASAPMRSACGRSASESGREVPARRRIRQRRGDAVDKGDVVSADAVPIPASEQISGIRGSRFRRGPNPARPRARAGEDRDDGARLRRLSSARHVRRRAHDVGELGDGSRRRRPPTSASFSNCA